jgi:hypothetical protein
MSGPRHTTDEGGTHAGSLIEATAAVPRTDLQLRNYDDQAYAVEVVVRDEADDSLALERIYDLAPGECRAERDVLARGSYEVTAGTASGKRDGATCRVGEAPTETVTVEVGNHVVTVADGL